MSEQDNKRFYDSGFYAGIEFERKRILHLLKIIPCANSEIHPFGCKCFSKEDSDALYFENHRSYEERHNPYEGFTPSVRLLTKEARKAFNTVAPEWLVEDEE